MLTDRSLRSLAAATMLILSAACTTTEVARWNAVGGSKADGAVVLGIEVPPKMGVSETIIQWDIEQANAEANRRCKNWGYGGAEMFGTEFPVLVTCRPQGFSPCWSKSYRVTYQCLDR